jgi:phosphoribosylglycinamide formyltransferase 1
MPWVAAFAAMTVDFVELDRPDPHGFDSLVVRHRRLSASYALNQRHAPMTPKRTAILISGRGSNMMSLVDAAAAAGFPAEIVSVIANRPDAAGIDWAAARGIPAQVIDHKAYAGREAFEAALHSALVEAGTELVCLAGFMRVLTPSFVAKWQGRMINIHPSLLPSFKGLHTHEQALVAGVRIAGCTVHFVVPEMDAGPIIAQAAVAVELDDDAARLAARILLAEHKIYPHALRLVASGGVAMAPGGAGVLQAFRPAVALVPGVNQPCMVFAPALIEVM